MVGDVLGNKDSTKGKGKGHTRETPYMVDNDAITDEIAADKGKGELITDLRPRDLKLAWEGCDWSPTRLTR
jgi:hypothetical protein